MDIEIAKKINFIKVKNVTYKNEKGAGKFYSITINSDFPFHEFIYSKDEGIRSIKVVNSIEEEITPKNAKSFLLEGQVILTKKELEEQLRLKLN